MFGNQLPNQHNYMYLISLTSQIISLKIKNNIFGFISVVMQTGFCFQSLVLSDN